MCVYEIALFLKLAVLLKSGCFLGVIFNQFIIPKLEKNFVQDLGSVSYIFFSLKPFKRASQI